MSYIASSALWDMASLRFTKMSLIASHILLYPSGTLRKPLTLSSTRKSFVVSSIGAKKISWLTGPCTLCIDRAKEEQQCDSEVVKLSLDFCSDLISIYLSYEGSKTIESLQKPARWS